MIALALWHLADAHDRAAAAPIRAEPRRPPGPPPTRRRPRDPPTDRHGGPRDGPSRERGRRPRPTTAAGPSPRRCALIADDLRACVTPDVLIKPNLVSHRRQLPSTHADTLSATLDAVLAAGARRA